MCVFLLDGADAFMLVPPLAWLRLIAELFTSLIAEFFVALFVVGLGLLVALVAVFSFFFRAILASSTRLAFGSISAWRCLTESVFALAIDFMLPAILLLTFL